MEVDQIKEETAATPAAPALVHAAADMDGASALAALATAAVESNGKVKRFAAAIWKL